MELELIMILLRCSFSTRIALTVTFESLSIPIFAVFKSYFDEIINNVQYNKSAYGHSYTMNDIG